MRGALVAGAVAVAFFAGIIWLAMEDQKEWEAFAAAHDCRLVAQTRARTGVATTVTGNGSVGTGSVYIPPTKTYLCDDGIEYTR